jgi:hypothetical protein
MSDDKAKPMTLDEKLRSNPRFVENPSRGGGFIMPAARPPEPKPEADQPPKLSPEEAAFIADMEQYERRKFTPQEARWYVAQTQAIGGL